MDRTCHDLAEGVGTQIHRLLARLGIDPAEDDACGCCELAHTLNDLGTAWCEAHRAQIVDRLLEAARDRGLPAVRLAADRLVGLAIWLARRRDRMA